MLRLIILVAIGIFAQQSFADEPEAIVGGQPAAPGEFPYQCSLNMNGRHFCGCSILSPTHILTAAHCIYGLVRPPYNNCVVRTGHINSNAGQSHAIHAIYLHSEYAHGREHSWKNDIAMIKLRSPITYNAMQRPIDIAAGPPNVGDRCVLSGWGMTRANGPLSPNLLKMPTTIQSNSNCQAIHRLNIYHSQVCAFTRQGIGACQGDSGGPLVCNGRQVGITSWVAPCAVGAPDVYTSVYHHRGFIQQAMRS